jgi:hypothetical protein
VEHLLQDSVMSPSIDLKILESHCDMSSESHSSLGKWLLYFYWAPLECECLDTCSQVIMEPEVIIMTHPTLNWTHPWSTVREVTHKCFGWRSSQRHMIYKIENWTSGLSQALWQPGELLWPHGDTGTWMSSIPSAYRGKLTIMDKQTSLTSHTVNFIYSSPEPMTVLPYLTERGFAN